MWHNAMCACVCASTVFTRPARSPVPCCYRAAALRAVPLPVVSNSKLAEVEDEAESLRVQVEAHKQTIAALTEESDRLRAENQRLRVYVGVAGAHAGERRG